ncbi:EpsG family protein [Myroides odoratimimus]|uniref:EpsG family protein n=1 Tax=Myroides odoratimimus TaxID=76832 RepID=UPI0004688520|nr:EpsG family protein [Myroides odoratimimus]
MLNLEYIFIKEYYYSVFAFIFITLFLFLLRDFDKNQLIIKIQDFFVLVYSIWLAIYLGNRPLDVGVDTKNYYYLFNYNAFEGDLAFGLIIDFFSKLYNFKIFLIFCAFVYVFSALYGFRKIFKKEYVIPFLFFLISPYFMQFGINVMRSGMAASIFIVFIGLDYKGSNKLKYLFLVLSVMIHLSMGIVYFAWLFAKRNIKLKPVVIIWFVALFLTIFKINFLQLIIPKIPLIGDRFGWYVMSSNYNSEVSWANIVIYGVIPILVGFYVIEKKLVISVFYKNLYTTYIFLHIFYVLLFNINFSERIGYLADFMLPLIFCYPLLSLKNLRSMKFRNLKIGMLIGFLFLVKSITIMLN